jgi:hypothetical protein
MPKPTSKAQAGFLGAVASGKKKVPGLTAAEARTRLRGANIKDLPKKKSKKKRATPP